ncbi:MAG TPA: type II secretion system protein GspE, partial [Myxococcales bacterium]|nr:type II secretion system protein GspE [Myxococcales bacterium]
FGHTTPEKIEEALQIQKEKGGRLGAVLVGLKAVTEEQVLEALGAQLDLPLLREIRGEQLDLELVRKVPINFAKQARLLPLRLEGELAAVAINDPLDTAALDYARALLGAPVEPRLATETVLIDAINAAYDRALQEGGKMLENLDESAGDDLAHELEELPDLIDTTGDEAPIIKLVNSLLKRAVKERVSDIHIEPYEREVVVRFRKDGVLHEIIKPPKRYQKAIASRVKIMGQLNIAETRLPQDGR